MAPNEGDRPRVATIREDREHGSAWLSVQALEVLEAEAAGAVEGADPEDGDRPSNDWDGLASVANDLLAARPSMAVVANRVNRAMTRAAEERTPEAVETAASAVFDQAAAADSVAAMELAERLPDRVATLSRSGTVGMAIREAEPEAVLVAESRPGREGVGVAMDMVDGPGLPETAVTVTTDAAFPGELVRQETEALAVGADRILPDGQVVNKVGTRGAATTASADDLDCYAVAAVDKIATDDAVDREERDPDEVYDGESAIAVENPTFEVTPPDRFDAVVTERGALTEEAVREVAAEHRTLTTWQ